MRDRMLPSQHLMLRGVAEIRAGRQDPEGPPDHVQARLGLRTFRC